MAEFQTASAVISLAFQVAGLAHKAVILIKKIVQAETEAEALQHRTEHLEKLAKSVGKVLRFICDKLKPYDGQREHGTLDKISSGFKLVISESFIESQEKIINTHLQNLTLSVTLLNNLDHIDGTRQRQEQTHYLREVRTLVEAIVRQVVDEQSSVFKLLDVDASDSHDSPEADDDDASDQDSASEDSDLEIDLTKRCPECWKRNLPVPDTPLAIAVKREQSENVRGILETSEEEDIRVRDAEDWTLLHYAAHKADHATLCVLLESSIGRASNFVNAKSKDGQTALMQIAKQADAEKSLELAEELIAHGCDIDVEDESDMGRSALYFAVDGPKTPNREAFIDLLVGKGAQKATIRDKFPEKASFYPALREESPNGEGKGKTSSISQKLSRAFSRSES